VKAWPKHFGFILRQLGDLLKRPAAFRPLLTEGLALSGESLLFKRYSIYANKGADYVNMGNQIVKIIFFSVNWSQMVSILDKDLLISISKVGLKGNN